MGWKGGWRGRRTTRWIYRRALIRGAERVLGGAEEEGSYILWGDGGKHTLGRGQARKRATKAGRGPSGQPMETARKDCAWRGHGSCMGLDACECVWMACSSAQRHPVGFDWTFPLCSTVHTGYSSSLIGRRSWFYSPS